MVVMSIKVSDGNVIRSRNGNENGDCSTNRAPVRPVKWKQRNVCAVRDFPPGCGPVPLVINVANHEAEPVSSPVGNDHVVIDIGTAEPVGNLVVNHEAEPASSPVANDHVVIDIGTDEPLGNLVNNGLQNGDVKVDNGGSVVKEHLVNNELQNGDVKVDNGGIDIGIKVGRPRMKFKPRKFCAVRDFPPFCGLNAGEPTEEERRRINEGRSAGTESNGSVKGDSVHKTQSSEPNEGSKAKMGSMKCESSKKVQNIGQACQELVVYTRDQDTKNVTPVNDAHDGDSEEDERDNTPLSRIQKNMNVKNKDVGSKKHVEKRPLDDHTKDSGYMGGKIKVIMGLKAPSLCAVESQQKVLINKAKGHASSSTGKVADTGKLEKIEKDINNKKKEDASVTPKKSKKQKQKKDFVPSEASSLTMVLKNEEEIDLTNGEEEQPSVTPKRSKKKKQKPLTSSALAMVVRNEEDFVADLEEKEGYHDVDVSLPPFGPTSSTDARNKVRQTLRLFQALCRKIVQVEEAKTNDAQPSIKRVDLTAKDIMERRGRMPVLGEKTYGPVPGVEVGDEFQYRVELALVGLHRPYQSGIDYVKKGKEFFAVSVVASGGYDNNVNNPDRLTYSGAGGVAKDKTYVDQTLERGNLALKNNVELKYPVRVIRGDKVKFVDPSDSKSKELTTYVYDGLYTVEEFRKETGRNDKLVFKYELKRVPGQPQLAKREVMSKKFKTREGVCVKDISNGKEVFPVCAINTVDDEKPPMFTYITKIMYPDWYNPTPPIGCDCVGRCSGRKCACAFKNGGEIRYNRNGAIVEAKPVVYECGPSCRCPPSCYNRVTQHGMKIHLEIFKTESRGWGVRSLSSISSGSFICEYVGELLEEAEAEERKGSDEYLFDIGQNYNDCSVNLDVKVQEIVNEGGGFTIDALNYGNVGRFINHSCSPNLYAQNVLWDQDDLRMPHIMLFAAENIPPLQELTYHYNYAVDAVLDDDGNIKVKSCYCGSSECTGRLY